METIRDTSGFYGPASTWMTAVGFVTCLFLTVKFLSWLGHVITVHLYGRLVNNSKRLKDCGKWAVVTGASDGIGKGYATELAKVGLNVVLISLPEGLEEVAAQIRRTYGVETKTIAVDFTDGLKVYEKIRKELADLEIGVLVNNVGINHPHPELFLELPSDLLIKNIISVNVGAVTFMCRLLLPRMVDRRKGVVINVSSASVLMPCPLLSVYAGTKSYVACFTDILQQEYGHYGITIQCVMPFHVKTQLSGLRTTGVFIPPPEKFAREAVNTVGLTKLTYGCLPHALQAFAVGLLPAFLVRYLYVKQYKTLKDDVRRQLTAAQKKE